jgi:hypothetical protein
VSATVLLLVGFVVYKSTRKPAPKPPPPVVEAPPVVAPTPVAAVEPPKPAAPPPAPLPSAQALRSQLVFAKTAEEAAKLAADVERLKDPALSQFAWSRVLELDPEHADARAKLEVRATDPSTEFAGFDAIASTPQRVHLTPFQDAARVELPRTKRAELVARWGEERVRLEERVTKAKSDPFLDGVDQFRLALPQKSSFFAALQYEMVECKPYALFVEVEGDAEARQKRRDEAEKSYVPFLTAYDQRIRSYLFPLAPKPPKEEPPFPVFVFLRVERYHDYSRSEGSPPPLGMRAHYNSAIKQCFTYSPVIKLGLGAFQDGVQALLHELTHAWVDRLASGDGGESRSIQFLASHWFSEGIAEYMSCQFLHQNEVRFQPWRSQRVAGAYRPPGWRIATKEALAIPIHALDAIAQLKVADLPADKQPEAVANISSGFYADMSNFILWLNLRSGANRAAQFEAYARAELSGEGGMDAFRKCVPGLFDEVPDLDGTIDDFIKRIANGKINPYKEFAEAQEAGGSKN